MPGQCERARQWASMDADGELSSFEAVLLSAHLADCVECNEFHSTVGQFTQALRTAPLVPFTATVPRRVRRRVSRSFASAVAAVAVAAVGLGSIVASSHLGSPLASRNVPPVTALELVGPTHDAVNAQALKAVQNLPVTYPRRVSARVGGGPYVSER